MKPNYTIGRCCVATAFCLLFTSVLYAQLGKGVIAGTVLDPSGAALREAAVALVNEATGLERTMATNSAGIYRFDFLDPRRRGFPHSLDRTPFLLPSDETAVRPKLDQWFEAQHIRPAVAGQFDDFSLLRTFAEAGLGIFAAPVVLDRVMHRRYGFVRIGRTEEIRAHFYAISVERKIRNPAVVAICDSARQRIFRRQGV
jgi:hypothetical protein